MTTWLNLRPHEWLATMKQHEHQAFCADAKPKIRFRPAPHRTSRIKTFAERSVSWILSLAGVTFFKQNIMVFCIFTLRKVKKSNKLPHLLQNIAFGEKKPAAKSRKLQGFIVSNFRIVSFFEKVSIK